MHRPGRTGGPRLTGLSRPLVAIGITSGAAGVAIGLAPFVGGLPGLAVGMFVFGVSTGFDGVLAVTVIQKVGSGRDARPGDGAADDRHGREFPGSHGAGLLARHLGPTAIFPIAGALLASAMLVGLTQREWREFGTRVPDRRHGRPSAGCDPRTEPRYLSAS